MDQSRGSAWGWGLAALVLAVASPAVPAAGQTAELRRTAERLEAAVAASCASADEGAQLARRAGALRAEAGPRPAWLYALAPTALLGAARQERLAGDLGAAAADYQAWLDLAPRRHRDRPLVVKERDGIEAERRLLAAGVARPGPGWMVWESRAVALADGAQATAAIWVRARCRAIAAGEVASEVALYGTAGQSRGQALALPDELVSFAPERPVADLTGSGAPVLVLRAAAGGGCWGCNRLRLVRADGDGLVQIQVGESATVVPFAVEDVSGDGRLAVLASDARWEGFAGLCPSCAPVPTLVYRWRVGRLVETCREEHAYYERETINTAALLGQETLADYALGRAVTLLLNRLQQGAGESAWPAYVADLGRVREMAGARAGAIDAAERDLRLALDRAGPAMHARGCPVLGLDLP